MKDEERNFLTINMIRGALVWTVEDLMDIVRIHQVYAIEDNDNAFGIQFDSGRRLQVEITEVEPAVEGADDEQDATETVVWPANQNDIASKEAAAHRG